MAKKRSSSKLHYSVNLKSGKWTKTDSKTTSEVDCLIVSCSAEDAKTMKSSAEAMTFLKTLNKSFVTQTDLNQSLDENLIMSKKAAAKKAPAKKAPAKKATAKKATAKKAPAKKATAKKATGDKSAGSRSAEKANADPIYADNAKITVNQNLYRPDSANAEYMKMVEKLAKKTVGEFIAAGGKRWQLTLLTKGKYPGISIG